MPDIGNNKVLRLLKNQLGRDFVVGDIHGNFHLLDIFYKEVNFDGSRDRILCVGDVIDRGPDSASALEYVKKHWFFLVRGNHEEMLIDTQNRDYGMYEMWMKNGGEWADDVSDELLQQMSEFYQTLPYIIEVQTDRGKVGIVHADMPAFLPWDQTLEAIEKDKLKDQDFKYYLWARESYRKLRMHLEYPGTIREIFIEGVYKIYVGHSIVKQPVAYGNIMFVDTGAYSSGKLSFVDLGTEEIIMIQAA